MAYASYIHPIYFLYSNIENFWASIFAALLIFPQGHKQKKTCFLILLFLFWFLRNRGHHMKRILGMARPRPRDTWVYSNRKTTLGQKSKKCLAYYFEILKMKKYYWLLEGVYKPHRQTRVEGGQNCSKFCPRCLYTPPYDI